MHQSRVEFSECQFDDNSALTPQQSPMPTPLTQAKYVSKPPPTPQFSPYQSSKSVSAIKAVKPPTTRLSHATGLMSCKRLPQRQVQANHSKGLVFRINFGSEKPIVVGRLPTNYNPYAHNYKKRQPSVSFRAVTPKLKVVPFSQVNSEIVQLRNHEELHQSVNELPASIAPESLQQIKVKETKQFGGAKENMIPFNEDIETQSEPRLPKCQRAKLCDSCKTRETPVWRELKQNWGPNWDQVLLCNACGLQWRMCHLRCLKCHYVPRAGDRLSKSCVKCNVANWLQ